jgi:hypothetical protein
MDLLTILAGLIVGVADTFYYTDQTGVVWMNLFGWLQYAVYIIILLALVNPRPHMRGYTRASGRS